MVALIQTDTRPDAFSFDISTLNFDVVTKTSPQQEQYLRSQESAADLAALFAARQQAANQQPASVSATAVQFGVPANSTQIS